MNATVYVPTLAGGDKLLRALRSLAAQTRPVRIVVADNGAPAESTAAARAEIPELEVVPLGRNAGFGPALNHAVRLHPSDALVFVNDDVECPPTFVEALLEQLVDGVDMVAGVLVQHPHGELIDSAGVVVDETLLAFDYLHGEPLETLAGARPPLAPTGGAALFRADTFAAVGGFDERIFAYLEDVDLGLRLRRAGARCRLATEARAVHRHASTLGSGSAQKNWHMGWSRGYLLRRYGVLRAPRRAARALLAEAVICAGQAAVDRTLTGVTGRVAGWRGAADLPALELEDVDTVDLSLREALSLRSRRRQLPWRRKTEPAARLG